MGYDTPSRPQRGTRDIYARPARLVIEHGEGDRDLTELNGHAVPLINAPAQPEPEYGSTVELDPKRLGIEGNQLLGQIQALSRWQAMFAAYAAKTLDLRERQVLLEVAKALAQNAEQFKITLSQLAVQRKAAVIKQVKPDSDNDEGSA